MTKKLPPQRKRKRPSAPRAARGALGGKGKPDSDDTISLEEIVERKGRPPRKIAPPYDFPSPNLGFPE